LGASDYIAKPTQLGASVSIEHLAKTLTEKIDALCAMGRLGVSVRAPHHDFSSSSSLSSTPRKRIDVVAVAASTGGPVALLEIVPQLPEGFPVPLVIVQHMPPMFTRQLAKTLDAKAAIAVTEASGGESLAARQAWIAPGDYHMEVALEATRGVLLQTRQTPPVNSCRPAADVLFESVAKVYGASSLGVVLTGMGKDGLRGCQAIRNAGGQVIVQDEPSSVVWGMPGYVAEAGLANEVLPLSAIATAIRRRVGEGRDDASLGGGAL
jgi:two-component system chemotaxis response regulator CheB